MTTHRYKNTSDEQIILVGIGVFGPGEVFESDQVIEHPQIKVLKDEKKVDKKDPNDAE